MQGRSRQGATEKDILENIQMAAGITALRGPVYTVEAGDKIWKTLVQ